MLITSTQSRDLLRAIYKSPVSGLNSEVSLYIHLINNLGVHRQPIQDANGRHGSKKPERKNIECKVECTYVYICTCN